MRQENCCKKQGQPGLRSGFQASLDCIANPAPCPYKKSGTCSSMQRTWFGPQYYKNRAYPVEDLMLISTALVLYALDTKVEMKMWGKGVYMGGDTGSRENEAAKEAKPSMLGIPVRTVHPEKGKERDFRSRASFSSVKGYPRSTNCCAPRSFGEGLSQGALEGVTPKSAPCRSVRNPEAKASEAAVVSAQYVAAIVIVTVRVDYLTQYF